MGLSCVQLAQPLPRNMSFLSQLRPVAALKGGVWLLKLIGHCLQAGIAHLAELPLSAAGIRAVEYRATDMQLGQPHDHMLIAGLLLHTRGFQKAKHAKSVRNFSFLCVERPGQPDVMVTAIELALPKVNRLKAGLRTA